jgi:hypothetical protein
MALNPPPPEDGKLTDGAPVPPEPTPTKKRVAPSDQNVAEKRAPLPPNQVFVFPPLAPVSSIVTVQPPRGAVYPAADADSDTLCAEPKESTVWAAVVSRVKRSQRSILLPPRKVNSSRRALTRAG